MENKIMLQLLKYFAELRTEYPTPEIEVDFVVRDARKYEMENESFVTDLFDEQIYRMTIVLFYHPENRTSNTDVLMKEKYNIAFEHLPFWYLFHEYGHVYTINKLMEKEGPEAGRKYLEQVKSHTDIIANSEENHLLYKETEFEKEADLFAKMIYMDTVKELVSFFENEVCSYGKGLE